MVFYTVRAGRKFDFRLAINERPNVWRRVETESRAAIQIPVSDRMYVFAALYARCAGQLHSLWKNTLIVCDSTMGWCVMHKLSDKLANRKCSQQAEIKLQADRKQR